MAEELRRYFYQIMKTVEGVHAIIVTDREGVPLLQVRDDTVQDYTVRANVLATSGTALEQGSKIGLGQTKTVTAMFSNHQLVCFNKLPLVVTILADRKANTGHILSLELQFSEIIDNLRQLVDPVV